MRTIGAAVAAIGLPFADAPPERATKARNSKRARHWREQLERATGAMMERAATPEQRDAVEAAHRQEVQHGPDWARIRRGSTFGKVAAIADRNELARFLHHYTHLEVALHRMDRKTADAYGRRIRLTLPRTARPVVMALVALAKRYPNVHPSIARLASMARCSRSTACHVLDVLEYLGIVERVRRRKVVETPFGRRQAQDTSCYRLTWPEQISIDGKRVQMPARRSAPSPTARPGAPLLNVNLGQQLSIRSISRPEAGASAPPMTTNGAPELRPRAGHDWRAVARAALERRR